MQRAREDEHIARDGVGAVQFGQLERAAADGGQAGVGVGHVAGVGLAAAAHLGEGEGAAVGAVLDHAVEGAAAVGTAHGERHQAIGAAGDLAQGRVNIGAHLAVQGVDGLADTQQIEGASANSISSRAANQEVFIRGQGVGDGDLQRGTVLQRDVADVVTGDIEHHRAAGMGVNTTAVVLDGGVDVDRSRSRIKINGVRGPGAALDGPVDVQHARAGTDTGGRIGLDGDGAGDGIGAARSINDPDVVDTIAHTREADGFGESDVAGERQLAAVGRGARLINDDAGSRGAEGVGVADGQDARVQRRETAVGIGRLEGERAFAVLGQRGAATNGAAGDGVILVRGIDRHAGRIDRRRVGHQDGARAAGGVVQGDIGAVQIIQRGQAVLILPVGRGIDVPVAAAGGPEQVVGIGHDQIQGLAGHIIADAAADARREHHRGRVTAERAGIGDERIRAIGERRIAEAEVQRAAGQIQVVQNLHRGHGRARGVVVEIQIQIGAAGAVGQAAAEPLAARRNNGDAVRGVGGHGEGAVRAGTAREADERAVADGGAAGVGVGGGERQDARANLGDGARGGTIGDIDGHRQVAGAAATGHVERAAAGNLERGKSNTRFVNDAGIGIGQAREIAVGENDGAEGSVRGRIHTYGAAAADDEAAGTDDQFLGSRGVEDVPSAAQVREGVGGDAGPTAVNGDIAEHVVEDIGHRELAARLRSQTSIIGSARILHVHIGDGFRLAVEVPFGDRVTEGHGRIVGNLVVREVGQGAAEDEHIARDGIGAVQLGQL